jgi:hypothetical protein
MTGGVSLRSRVPGNRQARFCSREGGSDSLVDCNWTRNKPRAAQLGSLDGHLVQSMVDQPKFEVALSFAGEDRPYVRRVAAALERAGVRVFYDEYEQATLWGKNLYVHLREVYRTGAQYTVLFISEHYARKLWTNHERESAQARAFEERQEYILPARFDDTEIPGILPTTGYIDLTRTNPEELAALIVHKLGGKGTHSFQVSLSGPLPQKAQVNGAGSEARQIPRWCRGLIVVLSLAAISVSVTATLMRLTDTPALFQTIKALWGQWYIALGSTCALFCVIFSLLLKAYKDIMKLLGLVLLTGLGYLVAPFERAVPALDSIPKLGWLVMLLTILVAGYVYFSYRLVLGPSNHRMQPTRNKPRAADA